MYYPLLRGKQFELIALREFSQESPHSHIFPIIEPVKLSLNSLITAINTMVANKLHFALVLNPHNGDFRRSSVDIYQQLRMLLGNANVWTPAFIYRDNVKEIEAAIAQHNLSQVMIIFTSQLDTSNNELLALLSSDSIKYIVADFSRLALKKLSNFNKELILFGDKFQERARNADYLEVPEEVFSEDHLFYRTDGFVGFSDYTALPSAYKENGMLPYAVAIHMTYCKNNEAIFIRHFVSDTNDDTSNIHRKFFEAAIKLENFFNQHTPTKAVLDILQMLKDNKYPGLGVLKKISVKNHLELIETLLARQE